MNSDVLESAIREVVRASVSEETVAALAGAASGARSREERAMGRWYRRLSRGDRARVDAIVALAVEETITGVLRILEDVRVAGMGHGSSLEVSMVVEEE